MFFVHGCTVSQPRDASVVPVWDGELLSASENALRKSKPCWNPAHAAQHSEPHETLLCVTPHSEKDCVPTVDGGGTGQRLDSEQGQALTNEGDVLLKVFPHVVCKVVRLRHHIRGGLQLLSGSMRTRSKLLPPA